MSYKKYINIDLNTLSKSEQNVHFFILENSNNIINMTVDELAQNSFTSRATIDRYLKKVNINGFKELKFLLQNDIKDNNISNEFINILKSNKNKKILTIGLGSSYISSLYLARRLNIIDYDIVAKSVSDIIGLKNSYDLLIIFSNSGSIIHYEDIIKSCSSIPILAITKKDSKLSTSVDYYIDNKITKQINNIYEHDNQVNNILIVEQIFNELK